MKKIVPVYPWPMHSRVADALALIPGITPVPALSGGPGPVLAIKSPPPFVCDAVVVLEPEKLAQGVQVVIEDGIRMVTVRDMFSEAIRSPERLTDTLERAESKVKFQ